MTILRIALILSLLASPAIADNPLGLKVHHITASVTDIDRAIKWYTEMLGFRLDDRGSRGAMLFAELSIPGFGVAFVQEGARPAAPAPGPAPASAHWQHIVFAVADPERTFNVLKDRGANPRTRAPPGQPIASFLVNDSEGNEIEFVKANPGK